MKNNKELEDIVKKANLDVVRENNRKLVLQTLFNSEKTSRSLISKAVGRTIFAYHDRKW